MALFQVHRDITGWTEEDLDAAAIRTQTCAAWFDGMRWIRSFLNPVDEALVCYYEAASEADIRSHAAAADVPCGRVVEVREVVPLELE